MFQFKPAGIRSILCIGAHVDDIEIGCGASLLSLVRQSSHPVEITWVVACATEQRAAEARRSADYFGSEASSLNLKLGDFRDSYLPYEGGDVKEFIHGIVGEVSPDLIFTHRREDLHQDHRILAELTWNAFRDHLILEYEIPKYEGDLGSPNVFVPVERDLAQRKIEMLGKFFPSQADKPWFSDDTFWALLRLRGLECRSPTGLAEAFHGRKIVF